jgi:UPF0755 protein
MTRYSVGQKTVRRKSKVPRRVTWLLVAILVLAAAGAGVSRVIYSNGLKPVNSSQQTQIFTVKKGSSVKIIAVDLENARLIRSAWAFQLYVHSKELNDKLQAGTYAFAPSETVAQIVNTLTNGKVTTNLVTILPGRRIDQVRADLINDGFSVTAVDRALDPAQYGDLPVLSYKPDDVNSLEGLLWPDSYQKQPDTDPSVIIRESLQAMGDHLTADVQAAFAAQGLSPYRGLILSSIVIQEVNKPADQAQAAQVFLTRLKAGMMLGSDVTARYGAIAAGRTPSLDYDSAYNTLLHKELPPSPISTISQSSLDAVTHPAGTSWVYFVTGDDGTTHFSSTLDQHQALTKQYCHKLCGE